MKKKTLTELYYECKHQQELKQQLKEKVELLKKQLAKDLFDAHVASIMCPPPIPPIPQTFQGKV